MNRKFLPQFILVTVAVIILSLLYFLFPASTNKFYPNCIFHSLTGLDCPGCGSQRAASALLHGRVGQALDFNVLFVLVVPLIVYAAFIFSWNVFSARKLRQPIFYSPLFVKTLLVVVIVFSVARNVPMAPFTWLKA